MLFPQSGKEEDEIKSNSTDDVFNEVGLHDLDLKANQHTVFVAFSNLIKMNENVAISFEIQSVQMWKFGNLADLHFKRSLLLLPHNFSFAHSAFFVSTGAFPLPG